MIVNLERSQAEAEIRELEVRLRIVPMNDAQLRQGLRDALEQKRGRLERLSCGVGSRNIGAERRQTPKRNRLIKRVIR